MKMGSHKLKPIHRQRRWISRNPLDIADQNQGTTGRENGVCSISLGTKIPARIAPAAFL